MRLRNVVAGGVAMSLAGLGACPGHAAEFGTGPWVKGYTDVFGGVIPTAPGVYLRTDAYHYSGDAGTTIFDG
ncbi:MAG TPA: hypothetical protein VMW24_17880, partial [Sedimentisphaerales bacterium]|nr:hypothetical protein [Sedimentisphaerales bacterium]